MAKINRTYVKNIKNIDEFVADLNGATAYIIGGNTKGKTHFFRETEDDIDLDEKYYLQMALATSNEEYRRFCVNEFNYKTLCGDQDTDVYLYSNGMSVVKTP